MAQHRRLTQPHKDWIKDWDAEICAESTLQRGGRFAFNVFSIYGCLNKTFTMVIMTKIVITSNKFII